MGFDQLGEHFRGSANRRVAYVSSNLGRLLNHSESCQVWKVASLLAEALSTIALCWRTTGVKRVRDDSNSFLVCSAFYLQNAAFSEWAMLGSNQRPLPCEGSALPLS